MVSSTLSIAGFRVAGFRTIRNAEVICDGPLTVICGPNNSGKSSLLEALLRYPYCLSVVQGKGRSGAPRNSFGEDVVHAEVAVPIRQAIEQLWTKFDQPADRITQVIEDLMDAFNDSRIWFGLTEEKKESKATLNPDFDQALAAVARNNPYFARFRSRVAEVAQTSVGKQVNARIARLIAETMTHPEMIHIADVRRAADRPLTDDELGVLARSSSLRPNGSRLIPWTETLGLILKDTFGSSVEYHVPPSQNNTGHFMLDIDGDSDIDLSKVGAGVREVVAIAYKTLQTTSAKVLLIEEPENCLHPIAVRRLLQSLVRRVGLQLIVSTHSASVIDSNPTSLVQVARTTLGTQVQTVRKTSERFEAVRSLGYSPSELLLTPCAVWVEGPSDRIYLKVWLASEKLTEGVDFQIMFYGGSLGSHVSAEMEPTPEQAAAIRSLSRRCVIVADSDKRTLRQPLKPHVKRWKDEIKQDPHALLWITRGREMENLLTIESINLYRASKRRRALREHERRFGSVFKGIVRPDKVRLAKEVVAADPNPPPDAYSDVRRLAAFIRASQNRIET